MLIEVWNEKAVFLDIDFTAADLIIAQGENGAEIRRNNQLLAIVEDISADVINTSLTNENNSTFINIRDNPPTIDLYHVRLNSDN